MHTRCCLTSTSAHGETARPHGLAAAATEAAGATAAACQQGFAFSLFAGCLLSSTYHQQGSSSAEDLTQKSALGTTNRRTAAVRLLSHMCYVTVILRRYDSHRDQILGQSLVEGDTATLSRTQGADGDHGFPLVPTPGGAGRCCTSESPRGEG
jgi:hypothetical protein